MASVSDGGLDWRAGSASLMALRSLPPRAVAGAHPARAATATGGDDWS
jgi:hypothetical protein